MNKATPITPREKIAMYSMYGMLNPKPLLNRGAVLDIYYSHFSTKALLKLYKMESEYNGAYVAGINRELEKRHPHIWPVVRRFF